MKFKTTKLWVILWVKLEKLVNFSEKEELLMQVVSELKSWATGLAES